MRPKRGRPFKYPENLVEKVAKDFEQYIDETDIPIIVEFSSRYGQGVSRAWMYEQSELVTLLKRCVEKKEAALERGALTKQLDTGMAAFSLKQLGWKDNRQEKVVFVDPKTLSDEELKKLISDGG